MNKHQMPKYRLKLYPWLQDAPELSPHSFTFQDHELDNSFLYCNTVSSTVDLPEGWICLGWADGGLIACRPKPDQLACRFADDQGNEFWCHVM